MAGQPGSEHGHVVQFYENDAVLVESVRNFFIPTLRAGNAAIVVATAPHRFAFEAALESAGIDVEAAVGENRYLAFDAADTLSRFMVDGAPDMERFFATIGAVMGRASRNGRRIRVYGEMVALLWEARDISAALALEGLWNDFAQSRTFELLCAYPAPSFDEDSAAEFERICAQHTEVIPDTTIPPFVGW